MDKEYVLKKIPRTLSSLKQPYFFEDTLGTLSSVGSAKADAEVKILMRNMLNNCDGIGFRFVGLGSVSLAIIIYAENLSVEEMIGRSVVISDAVKPFTKFDMRGRWAFPFYTNLFYTFLSSERSFLFRHSAQDSCKRTEYGLLRTMISTPISIDFQGKSVVVPKKLLSVLDKEPSEIESKMFNF
ncbi:MAG: hypothetical protein RLZZ350_904 [Verrucomicrobiota bacterium]|jgi:hypothetical protein